MSSSHNFITQAKRLDAIKPSGIRKMFARAQGLEGVISLGIGKPDLPPPAGLLDEVRNELSNLKAHGYTLNSGILPLREKIIEKYKNEYQLDYTSNGVVVGTGGTQILYTSIFAYTNPGDEVIVPDPGFVYYPTIPKIAGCKVKSIKLDDNFLIPIDELTEKFSRDTKLIIINSPNNPCGSITNEENTKAIADLAIDNNTIILSDEVYEYIIFDGNKHYPMGKYAPDNTITLNSFSKTYCITGWRLGYAVGNEELMKPLTKLHPFLIANPNSLGQYAISKFMGTEEDHAFQKILCETMQTRRNVVNKEFGKISGVRIPYIGGSFYGFPEITHDNYSSDNVGLEFAEDVFKNTKVVTVAGSEFGTSRNNNIRISFGSASVEILTEAAQRIREYLG